MISHSLLTLELYLFLSSTASALLMAAFRSASPPLGPFFYSVKIVGNPVHLGFSRREDNPDHTFLILVHLHILLYIGNLPDKTSNGIRPGIAIYLPPLYHHLLGLVDFPYEQLGPVPGITPFPLSHLQPLPNTPKSPREGIKYPLQIHFC